MGPGTASWMRCWSVPTRMVSLTGRSRSTPRSVALTSTAPISSAPQGAPWNHKNLRHEPPDHALGRSRGGLSTKIHQLVDGRSEEHTSELQSRGHLVCRLLLEK